MNLIFFNKSFKAGLFDYCNSTENHATVEEYNSNKRVFKHFIGMGHDSEFLTFGLAKPAIITFEPGQWEVILYADYWEHLPDYICYNSSKSNIRCIVYLQ